MSAGSGVRDQDTLILSFFSHARPSSLCNSKNMGCILVLSLVTILGYDGFAVKGQLGVWIDCHQEQA